MKIHHLNCATQCTRGGRLVSGRGSLLSTACLVCHCLLIETEAGLVLVDTGLGLDDVKMARSRLPRGFLFWANPRLDQGETAARQLERLGYSVEDVRHIIVTHLDFDHAGGLCDFPQATVHVSAREYQAVVATPRRYEGWTQFRYRLPQPAQSAKWRIHETAGEVWFGFEAVRPLPGLSADILLVPLTGHSAGHMGVAVRTADGWLLHAGDAYFFRGEVQSGTPSCPIGLRLFQRCLATDNTARLRNQQRLRQLAIEDSTIRIFSAHDPVEFRQLQGVSA